MHPMLEAALKRRERVWGAVNETALESMRAERGWKKQRRRVVWYDSRQRTTMPDGAYLTRRSTSTE